MNDPGVARLEQLVASDPAVAPMVRLLVLAFRAAEDPTWGAAVPALDASRLADGIPLLHGADLSVDPRRLQRQLESVAAAARAPLPSTLDAVAVVAASIHQDADALASFAAEASSAAPLPLGEQGSRPRWGREGRVRVRSSARRSQPSPPNTVLTPDLLATLAHAAALPLLLAVGRRAAPLLVDLVWDAGFCPVCAAWPTLAELRGLARERWLRCGRCGAGWPFPHQRCPFCVSRDHRQLGYLAAEADRESRRAATCDTCRGYLKTVSTLGPSSPAELAYQDLTTLELDIAALDGGYVRPETPAFPLAVTLAPARQRGFSLFGRR